MIKTIRSIAAAALIVVATTAGSTVTADKAPPIDPSSRFLVGTVKADVAIPPQIAYATLYA